MTRQHQLLSGLLLVQLAIAALLFWPRGGNTAGEAAPLLPDFVPADVTRLALEDERGETVRFERAADGWVVADSDGYPADATRIETLLTTLAGLQTDRLIANTAASQARLQVADDDFLRKFTLTTADGRETRLYVGSSPAGGAAYVRRGGDVTSYLARNFAAFDYSPLVNTWIDTVYIDIEQTAVTRVVVENATGTLTFVQSDGTWTLEGLQAGETFDATPLDTLLSRILTLRLAAPLGTTAQPAYGLDDPPARVTLTVLADAQGAQPAETYTLAIGTPDADGNYPLKWSESPYYVQATNFSVQPVLTATRDGFLVPPAAEPAAEP